MTRVTVAIGLAAIFCAVAVSSLSAQQTRLALVIGNGDYASAPMLHNPPEDARAMTAKLEHLGFKVITVVNGNYRKMLTAVDQFANELNRYNVGLFYYSGHGVQYQGQNYLIPVDANIQRAVDVQFEAVNAARVLADMGSSGDQTNIVILDACRNNPFVSQFRSLTRGLAVVQAPAGSMVIYSTAPDQIALDGSGADSPFTTALLQHIGMLGVEVNQMLTEVRHEVVQETHGEQVPWTSSSLTSSFYFAPGAAVSSGGGSVNEPTPSLTVTPATGSISITTATAGSLYLDGRMIGHIPAGGATLSSVEVGMRDLTMHYAEGHVEREQVSVRAGSTTDATFIYRPVPPGSRWTPHAMPSSQSWDSVTYGNGTFVAVADGGDMVATSSDGVNWTEGSLPSSQKWQSVTYGNGTFVAVTGGYGLNNVVATSSDGVNWTQGSLPSSQNWDSVTYGNGTFVALAGGYGPSNVVAASSDGVNWTEGSLPSSQNWRSVTYGNGAFVAVADGSNAVATSSDGVNWTEGSLPSSQNWRSVTYGNGAFIAVASGPCNAVATSSDGVNWTQHALPSNQSWYSVTSGNRIFVVIADGSNVVATSSDGANWTQHTLPSSQSWYSVTYGNGTFVAVADGNNVMATSP